MTKKAPERQRATFPGDSDDLIAQRREKERKENEAALKRKAELEKKSDTAPAVAPDKE